MYFIKLILIAIALELLGCFGLNSDEEKNIIAENETAIDNTFIPTSDDQTIIRADSVPERMIRIQI